MLATLLVVLPIFALILAGWGARRLNVLGPHATRELNRYVVYLALPALLFDIMANADWADFWQPGFIGAFGLAGVLVFLLTLVLRRRAGRGLADAAIDGLNAAYPNTGYMGFPLALLALGDWTMVPTTIATILTVCLFFAIAIVVIEAALKAGGRRRDLVVKVAGSLVRNPLLVAPALGALVPVLGLTVPAPAETFLKLLGSSASTCALVALGLFLAEKKAGGSGDLRAVGLLVGFKLLLMPMLAWVLATWVFALPAPLVQITVLIAALPTGTGPFMLAEFYQREAAITARVILISTIISIFTLSAYLAFGA